MSDTIAAPESVLAHATSDIPRARREQTVEQVRAHLLGQRYQWVCVVAIMDGDVLVGIVVIEDLMVVDAQ